MRLRWERLGARRRPSADQPRPAPAAPADEVFSPGEALTEPGSLASPEPAMDRGGMRSLAVATVFSGISGYAVTLVAARSLGVERYQVFAVFWGLFYAITGILAGLVQETTRAVRSNDEVSSENSPRRGARPLLVTAVIGAVLAAVLLLTAPLWGDRLLAPHATEGAILLIASTLTLAPQASLSGTLSGTRLWHWYAVLLLLDAGARLGAALWVAVTGAGAAAFLVVTVAGSVSWLVVVAISPAARKAALARADVDTGPFLRRCLHAMAASTAAAVLVVAFPVLLKATTGAGDAAQLSSVILAVTLTRAPFLVPLVFFQSAIVVYFLERRADMGHALRRPAALLALAAVVATVLAALIGPPLLRLLFGADFVLSGGVLGSLTFGAACTAWLLVTGCAALARSRHGLYSGGWLLAGGVALAVLVLPMGLSVRTAAALTVGPLVGSALHLIAIRTAPPVPSPATAH